MPRKKQQPEPEDEEGLAAYELPKSVAARMCRAGVPPATMLQKHVPTALVKGSTVFISYLAALSHDIATERNHKTINATHVLDAAKQLGWEDGDELYRRLKKELGAFRHNNELRKQGKLPPKPAAKAKASAAAAPAPATPAGAAGGGPPAVAIGEDADADVEGGATLLADDRANADEEDLYPEADENEDNTGYEEYVMSAAEDEDEDMAEAEDDAASEEVMAEDEVADPVGLEGDQEVRDE
ncbi:hypothetical protein JCM6882_006795 [Rhodosporidiobolus microsporus]